MSAQLPLELPLHAALGRAEFAVSYANRAAMTLIEGWQAWPSGKLVLFGPEGAGKTHLAHVWAEMAGAQVIAAQDIGTQIEATHIVVEDVPQIGGDRALEEALFHLHNRILGAGGRLLMTGQAAPSTWPITLPDLASRIQGTLSIALETPDEDLLSYILLKLFADRQLVPSPSALTTLTLHMERSFAEAGRLVAEMDRRAMAERRKITADLARDILDVNRQSDLPLSPEDAQE
jgi:chromosomal replication initiation ATPase DnaA